MKSTSYALLLFFSFFLGCKCKKDKDSTAPFVTIISPLENQIFTVGETIFIKFEIKDNTKIDFAQIAVSDENGIQVLSPVTFHDLENGQVVEQPILIDNTALATGIYFVNIHVSDGDNEQTFFKKIGIQELPLKRKAIYFVGSTVGQHNVYKIDSTYSVSFAYTLNGDFIGSAMDSKNNRLITAGGYTGKLQATNLFDYSIAWSENPVGSIYPSYRNIVSGMGLNFVSYNSGFIKGYSFSGAIQFNGVCEQSVYYPLKVGVSSKYVLSEQATFVGNTKKLVLYNFPSGSDKQEINFPGDAIEFISKNEEDFFIFYNLGNTGKISIYNTFGNGLSYTFPFSLSGKIISVAAINNTNFLVGTDNGIYNFTYNPQNYVLFKSGIKASKIKYDSTNNQVIASEGKHLYFYELSSGTLVNSVTATDSIADFQLYYNR